MRRFGTRQTEDETRVQCVPIKNIIVQNLIQIIADKYNKYTKENTKIYLTTKVRKHNVLATARGSKAATKSQTLILL